ncbi:MAG: pilus assembly FimT family protein [Stenotrophomonas sp.]|uniref:pilus assembly FimT family protein n=1 Tax=Stenotrophomonas sp. TaxID=69392 RepID=UPI0028B0ECB1|nr:prepilin-type N-terminal cleavage/methylation domain-containing protein [Stenotrophomonas sp.]
MSRRATGFSLIELMVTLAVMAVLALASMPFARQWIDSNRQMQARNLLWEAVSQTRSLALRNPEHVIGAATSARLQRSERSLQVLRGDGNEVLWQGELPRGGEYRLTGGDDYADAEALQAAADQLSCVAFDNRGQRLPGAASCSSGATHSRIAVGMNSQDPLYVDLL